MDCKRLEINIDSYFRNGMTDAQKEKFDSHLSDCQDCREVLAEHQALEFMLDSASDWTVDPPPYLAQRIMSNLPSKVASGVWTWRVFHPIVAAASIILAIGIGFLLNDAVRKETPLTPGVIQQVRIIFYSPEADSVALVGDFNEWGQREVTMAQASDKGIWEFTMNLDPGVYHYNLLVDGERWVANPKSSTLVPDGFGGYNSVLVVSEKCQSDCS